MKTSAEILEMIKKGETFSMSNAEHQESIQDDDVRSMEIVFHGEESGMPSWGQGFKLTFNGQLLKSTKTFKPVINKMNELIETWTLTEIDEDVF